MITKIATKAAIAIAFVFAFAALPAQADRAVIRGTLAIISNQFVVKMAEPFETEDDEGGTVSSTKVQITGGAEYVSELRALVGKKVQMDGEMFTASTRYHIEPLLLDISEGDFMESP